MARSGAANLQRGGETVGGHLYLTTERLVFESHRFNIQTGATEVVLADVREVTLGWTKFLGLIPLLPNAMVVHTDDQQFRLTVFGRRGWLEAIQKATGAQT